MTVPIYSMLDTWNAIGTTFNSIYMNISNGAGGAPVGAAASRAFRLDSNGSSIFDVAIDGSIGGPGFGGGTTQALRVTNELAGFAGGSLSYRISASQAAFGAVLAFSNGTPSSPDVFLARDAANILALRNGVNAQISRWYNTFTDASNGEWGFASWTATDGVGANNFTLGTNNNGTGSYRVLNFIGNRIDLYTGAANSTSTRRWFIDSTGMLLAGSDNTYDIGASGATRPRNIFIAGYSKEGVMTIGSLPTAASAGAGAHLFVTDALAPAFGVTIAAGGAANSPVYSNGTNWLAG